MRSSSLVLAVACVVIAAALNAHFVRGNQLCTQYAGYRLISRHWQSKAGATYSSTAVVNEFRDNFGPSVRLLPGFVEYYGATMDSISTNVTSGPTTIDQFFMNIFDTAANGQVAQNNAAAFVANGVLAAQIQRVLFLQSDISFVIANVSLYTSNCFSETFTPNYHMAARYWQLRDNATITNTQVADTFRTGFGDIISAQPGFKLYLGATVADGTGRYNFFVNVFDSAAGATSANALASNFVTTGTLNPQIQKVEFTENTILFDIKAGSTAAQFTPAAITLALCAALATLLAA